jgi:hypothetical protein
VGVGESKTARGQFVDVWCVDLTAVAAVAFYVANAQVVGQDENDVGLRVDFGPRSRRARIPQFGRTGSQNEQYEHAFHGIFRGFSS